MTKTNTVQNFDIAKFMSDFDMQVINKSITKTEAAIIYDAIMIAGLHELNKINTALSFTKNNDGVSPTGANYVQYNIKDITTLQDKLVKIMESQSE